jgi:hypothetical protein
MDIIDINTAIADTSAVNPQIFAVSTTMNGTSMYACESVSGGIARTTQYAYFTYGTAPAEAPNGTAGACSYTVVDTRGNLWVSQTRSSSVCVVSASTLGGSSAWGSTSLSSCAATVTGVNDPRAIAVRVVASEI